MKTFKVHLSIIVLAYIFATVSANIIFPVTKPNSYWWTHTTIYQLYPRSFKDSNNDGIGDLKGIIQKLDHFVDLGIETLWVGPIFKSPMDDFGYDIEDYRMIDPIFGTIDDLDELISEMNKRNLKLITDLIPNHSSYKCEWFQKSIKREGKYSDYYMWRDAKNQDVVMNNSSITPIPPNNWMSVFGGTGWTWNNERKQFYFHQFLDSQPDYNLRNPLVQQEIKDIMVYWMDKGISGFRFDATDYLFESVTFADEPYIKGKRGSLKYMDVDHIYTIDQPEVYDIIYEWRELLDNYTKTKNPLYHPIMTTEAYSKIDILMKYYGNSTKLGCQVPFNFGLIHVDKHDIVSDIDSKINRWLSNLPENNVANWVLDNHDNLRIGTQNGPESIPLFNALKAFLPGIDVTYYGSEIGMVNWFVRRDQRQDFISTGGDSFNELRDGERTPMQWDDSINAGFTNATKPWLPVNPNYYKINVEAQKNIPTSNYNFYKKMSQLRKTSTLRYGNLQTYNQTKLVYILKRSLPDYESYILVLNFGSETETVILSNVIHNLKDKLYVYLGSENSAYIEGSIVSTTSSNSHPLQLRPQSVVVLTDKEYKADISSGFRSIQSSSKLIGLLWINLVTILYTNYSVLMLF